MANKTAVISGGCFWGMEELFRTQPGIVDTEVGYSGGSNDNPTYQNHPGHAEALKLTYDDEQTTYEQILDYFFRIHDPTTMNQQGNDVGSSYRSTIFYENDEQLEASNKYIEMVNDSGLYDGKVVTSLEKLGTFWTAEEYHQDYLQKNPGGYSCHFERSSVPLSA